MTGHEQTKLAVLSALEAFGDRAVVEENLFLAARIKMSPEPVTRGGVSSACRDLEGHGSIRGAIDPLGRVAWRITTQGKTELSEVLP